MKHNVFEGADWQVKTLLLFREHRQNMRNEPRQEPVTLSLIDMDFIAVELDTHNCNTEVKWLRQVEVGSDEYWRGLGMALRVALELQAEQRKTHTLVELNKKEGWISSWLFEVIS